MLAASVYVVGAMLLGVAFIRMQAKGGAERLKTAS
jgi:hypothetical protein